jgi:hypothetical protein
MERTDEIVTIERTDEERHWRAKLARFLREMDNGVKYCSIGYFDYAVPVQYHRKYQRIGKAIRVFKCTDKLLSCIPPDTIDTYSAFIKVNVDKIAEILQDVGTNPAVAHLRLTRRLWTAMLRLLRKHRDLHQEHSEYSYVVSKLEHLIRH